MLLWAMCAAITLAMKVAATEHGLEDWPLSRHVRHEGLWRCWSDVLGVSEDDVLAESSKVGAEAAALTRAGVYVTAMKLRRLSKFSSVGFAIGGGEHVEPYVRLENPRSRRHAALLR